MASEIALTFLIRRLLNFYGGTVLIDKGEVFEAEY